MARKVNLIANDRDTYADDYLGDVRAVRGFDKRWRVIRREDGNHWATIAERISRKADALAIATDCIANTYGKAA